MGLGDIIRTLFASTALLFSAQAPYTIQTPVYAQDAQPQKQERKSLDELPILKKNRTTFEQAKKASDSTKIKYLDMLLVEGYQLIKDEKRNPDGFVPAWYFWQDKTHQKKAIEAITEEAKHEGIPDYAQRHVDIVRELLPKFKTWPRYKGSWGHEKNMTYLLIDKTIFDLNSEDELLSTLDKAYATLYAREYGVPLNDGKMDTKNRDLTFDCGEIIDLYAKRLQVENILKGKRTAISDEFKETAFSELSKSYNYMIERRNKQLELCKVFGSEYTQIAGKTFVKFIEETDASLLKLGYKIEKDSVVKAEAKESGK